jgi:putative holliday junction resolvase
MRILAIDYGERRIGLAISDELQMTARPLATIDRAPKQKSFARIVQIVSEQEVERVIVGLPLRLDGTAGDAAARVEKFIATLRGLLECPVEAWDERLTSVEAEERMRELGLNFAQRKDRVDQFAAMIILEDYLAGKAR